MNKMMRAMHKRKKGFTLIEIMIVIAIIAVLAAVLIPKINNFVNKANETGVITDFRSYQVSLESTGITSGSFKTDVYQTEDDLLKAINNELDARLEFTKVDGGAGGDYYESNQTDSFGTKYRLIMNQAGDAVAVVSAGANGVFETTAFGSPGAGGDPVLGIEIPSTATGELTNTAEDTDDIVLFVGKIDGSFVSKTSGLSKNIK